MGTQGRRIDEQTRARAVKLVEEQGISKSQVARMLDLHRDTVRTIVREHAEDRPFAPGNARAA